MSPTALTPAATALAVTVLWSSSWVLIRFGLDDGSFEPLTFAAIRYLLAATVLAGWALADRRSRRELRAMGRARFGRIVVLGVVLYTVAQGAQYVAIDRQPAATTSLVLALTPMAVVLLAGRSVGEGVRPRQAGGAALVGAGAWLYLAGDLGATAAGMAAATVALTANTTATLLGRWVNRSRSESPLVVTAASMGAGAVVLAAVALGIEGPPAATARGSLLVAWLALVNTALAFTLWNGAMRGLTAVEAAGINNTMLVQIALAGWLFLGEAPGAAATAGILTVSIGVLLTRPPGGHAGRRPGPPGDDDVTIGRRRRARRNRRGRGPVGADVRQVGQPGRASGAGSGGP